MRKLLVAVVVLLLLGAAADFAAARVFEGRVTEALQREYDLGQRPVVQVRDFPFLPHLLTGRFSTIDVAATDASARGINAAQLQLTLHGVRVPREVMLGEPGQVTVDRADGTIELTEAEVNRLLADRSGAGSWPSGRRGRGPDPGRRAGQPLDVQVSGKLGARDGGVTFTPDEIRPGDRGPSTPSQADLPPPSSPSRCRRRSAVGVRLERVDTRPGTVVLRTGGVGRGGRLIRWPHDLEFWYTALLIAMLGAAGVRRLRGLPPAQG